MLDRAGGTKRLTKPREGAAPDKQAGERILELLQGDVDESKSEYQELPGLFELFLAPLQPDVGHKEASLSLSKKFASFLVQAVKLSFEQLGKATKTTCRRKVEILASCACQAIDGLYTARQAVKGRPLEMELQTYGLVRRLVAVGLYNRAAKYGKILYLQLCSLYVDGRSASAVVSPSWPPAPSPAEKHDPEAPRLLVCCVLNALMCASAANGLDDAEPLDNLSPALHSIPPWLRYFGATWHR